MTLCHVLRLCQRSAAVTEYGQLMTLDFVFRFCQIIEAVVAIWSAYDTVLRITTVS